MNALVRTPLATTRMWVGGEFPDLPADAPLDMPAQSLREPADGRIPAAPSRGALRLSGLIAATLSMTVLALTPVCRVLAQDTIGPLDVVIIALVAMLFAWTAFSFLSAVAGFLAGLGDRRSDLGLAHEGSPPTLACRSAVLMPIYNEAPRDVFARVQAMCESIAATGAGDRFDIFILSDSTDRAIRAKEYGLFLRLKHRLSGSIAAYYRHRAANVGRKAGNIADWVQRFGAAYEHMVVLDADSLMEGDTLARLAAAMEQHPDVGLIQTAPVIVNRHTLFARTEQFASRLYGPMLARGVAWWSGSEGNYWGHNAIIRVAAFAQQAGLPLLNGAKPFGGHILSHDFVEAALLRRAGWRVCMAPDLGGSYEESPPTLAALLARDRRWCQGNLQHVKVLSARGLHWISRFHLTRGVLSYLVSPLWLALLGASALLPLRPEWGRRAGFTHGSAQAGDIATLSAVFGLSIGFLLAPKLMAFAQMVWRGERSRFGGARLAAFNMLLETSLSTLVAPLIMISHARSLAEIFAGRDSGWAAQARDASGDCLRQAVRLHAPDCIIGFGLVAVALATSVQDFVWMTPVMVGMAFAIPLAALLASGRIGRAARRAGLLLVPEERRPPQILVRAKALSGGWPPS
jgi:membrane glycosyltransferase